MNITLEVGIMKKIIALLLAIFMSISSVAYAESLGTITVGKHKDSAVVNFEGKIDKEHLVDGAEITVLVTENPGTEGERVAYVAQFMPDEFGNYDAKFVCQASDNSVLSVRYNGSEITDTLIKADINGKSKLLDAKIVLLTDREGVFDLSERKAMPEKKYTTYSTNKTMTYSSAYTFPEVTGVKAYFEVKNTYGLDETYTPMIACYDVNNQMIGIKIFDTESIAFDTKKNETLTEVIDLPEGTVRAKAFAWDKDKLIPFGDSNEGSLEKIRVILVGASTAWSVSEKTARYPMDGFGKFFGDYFNEEYVEYYNKSVSGASTTSFLEKHWAGTLALVEENTVVIVELGGNDRGKTSDEQFKANLMQMYEDVTARGGRVMFAGVTVDLGSMADGKFKHNDGRVHMSAMKKEIAEYTGSEFVSCEDDLVAFYNSELEKYGDPYEVRGRYFRDVEFLQRPESEGGFGLTYEETYLYEEDKEHDWTHTNMRAADNVAKIFYEAIAKSDSKLRFYFK